MASFEKGRVVTENFGVERRILEILGDHPRITKYLAWQSEFPTGLLFSEANQGSVQNVLDNQADRLTPALRRRWIVQAVESIAYIHSQGVMHGDLRPDNFLVHGSWPTDLDLSLCDFGGACCEAVNIPGTSVPDSGFFNPKEDWTSGTWTITESTDIFALGSVLYTIVTGHWPFRAKGGLFSSEEESELYEAKVDGLLAKGIFPDVDGLIGGELIHGCWAGQFATVQEIMASPVFRSVAPTLHSSEQERVLNQGDGR